jgi:hypothetical protein
MATTKVEVTDLEVAPPRTVGLDEVFGLLSPSHWLAPENDAPLEESRALSRAQAMGIDANSSWNVASIERTRMQFP